MKLHPPSDGERFAVIIDDCDGEGTEIVYFRDHDLAVAYLNEQYGGIPDITEPGGEAYLRL